MEKIFTEKDLQTLFYAIGTYREKCRKEDIFTDKHLKELKRLDDKVWNMWQKKLKAKK